MFYIKHLFIKHVNWIASMTVGSRQFAQQELNLHKNLMIAFYRNYFKV